MHSKREWVIALVPVAAALGILAFVLVRLAGSSGDGSSDGVAVTPPGRTESSSGAVPAVSGTDSRGVDVSTGSGATNLLPRLGEESDVSRSHLIAIGRHTRELSGDFLAIDLGPNVTPGPNEPQIGIPTTTYVFEVERYVKGSTLNDANTLTVRYTDWWDHTELNERVLLLLTPSRDGTYAAGVWTNLSERDEAVRFGNGDTVPEAEGMTLDEYADRLQGIAEAQASSGPPTALAARALSAGETITPTHDLALWMVEAAHVTRPGQSSAQVSEEDLAAFVAAGGLPVEIEEATLASAAGTARITISLEDGHVWEFEYDPSTGIAVYPSLGYQAQLVPAMQAVIAKYLD